ncbi:MAG: RluA family pseudouridine synthase [Planctomycetota bacterium]|jgi:23S rRNA pseudouridine1911/1915/1917 synthase|nr:RluA family pseudouridine synthase [Planctomycetota bacterium]
MIDPAKPYDLTFTVTPTYENSRLDLFVKAMVPSMSRSKIQRYCDAERILVNDEPRPDNWRVRLGDAVLLSCREPDNVREVAERIAANLIIIYEDDDILAINKPAGLVVHPAGVHRHDTLLNGLYRRYRDILPPHQHIHLVNRLDQYTSGIILAAKHLAADRFLSEQFEFRRVRKTYWALATGVIAADCGRLDFPLGPLAPGRTRLQTVRDDELGKIASTEFQVLERFAPQDGDNGLTWAQIKPHTGRQHQIRVHLAHVGHPLLADHHYGVAKKLFFDDGTQIARYALHAAELIFTHPNQEEMTLSAPLAADMTAGLARLRAGAPRRYGWFTVEDE